MRELNPGRIMFTASIDTEMIAPREAVYTATKAFISTRVRTKLVVALTSVMSVRSRLPFLDWYDDLLIEGRFSTV